MSAGTRKTNVGAAEHIRFALSFPFIFVAILISRPRLLRGALRLLYWLVMTPLAVAGRRQGRFATWRSAASRPGWVAVNVSSLDRRMYEEAP